MKRKVFTCLLCLVVALCFCSCKFESQPESEQSQAITKQKYFDKFSTYWGFALPNKNEEYWYIISTANDFKVYYVFKVKKEEINIEFEPFDSVSLGSQIEYCNRMFRDIPQDYLVNFTHDLSIFYREKYYSYKVVDKLYLIYDDTIQTLTIIDLRT